MEWFISQTDCIYKPSRMYTDDNQFKRCCVPAGKALPQCTPLVTAATRTKCIAVRIIVTLFLLILIMTIIYRISARNLSNFHYHQRIPQNPYFGNTLIGNSNQSSIPISYPTSKLEEPEDTDETQETPANPEEAENAEEMDQ